MVIAVSGLRILKACNLGVALLFPRIECAGYLPSQPCFPPSLFSRELNICLPLTLAPLHSERLSVILTFFCCCYLFSPGTEKEEQKGHAQQFHMQPGQTQSQDPFKSWM